MGATMQLFKRGTDVEIYPDMSEDGMLKINFNVTFPAVSCEHLSVGVQDVIGHRRANVTGTVKKFTKDPRRSGGWIEMGSKFGPLEKIQEPLVDDFMAGLVDYEVSESSEGSVGKSKDHDYDYEPIKEVDLKWIYDKNILSGVVRKERDGLYKAVKFTREWLEDEFGALDEYGEHEAAVEITPTNYDEVVKRFPLIVLDFHAPWCSHCKAFAPTYEAVSYIFNIAPHVPDLEKQGHSKTGHAEQIPSLPKVLEAGKSAEYFSENFPIHQKMLMGQVNCFKYEEFCAMHGVAGYPSVRVIRSGKDSVVDGMYEAYQGQRTVKGMAIYLTLLAQDHIGLDFFRLDPGEMRRKGSSSHSPKVPRQRARLPGPGNEAAVYQMNGCNIVGHVSGRRVPGILRFSLEGDSSFDARHVNMSHVIHHFSFGPRLDDKWHKYLLKYNQAHPRKEERLPQVGWRYEQTFTSNRPFMTYEHFARVVSTTFKYLNGVDFPAYEFSVSSNSFTHGKDTVEADPSEHERALPSVAFRYDLSPLQIFITETRMGIGQYVVILCAIIGGVYTIAGILDGVLLTGTQVVKKIRKKE